MVGVVLVIDCCFSVLIHLNFGDRSAADSSITDFSPDARSFEVHSRKTTHVYSDGCLHHVSAVIFACLLVDSIVEGGAPALGLVTTAALKKIKDCSLDSRRLREG